MIAARASAIAAAAALALAAAARTAHAESGAVVVVGNAAARDRATVAAAVRGAARSGAWELVETPFADGDVAAIVDCMKTHDEWPCVSPIAQRRGVERLIVVRVEPDRAPDGGAALTLTEQIVLPGSSAPTADQRFCARCSDETLTRVAFDLTRSLLEEASAGTARTKVTVRSTPPGAWITFDSVNVGLTDHTYATFPGHHVVIVQREGFATERREVDAPENRETVVAVDLRARDTGAAAPTSHPYVLPGIVTGIGAAGLIAGLALQAEQSPPSSEPQPSRLVSAPGIALVAGGAVALGIGAYLFVRAHRAAAPVAAPVHGGGIVGWAGSF